MFFCLDCDFKIYVGRMLSQLLSGNDKELIKKVVVIANRQQLFFVLMNLIRLMSETLGAVLIIFNVIYRFPNIRFLGSA